MENRAKLRFPRSLLSSLTSCKTHNLLSDVIHHRQPPLFSPSNSQIPFSSTSIDPLLPSSSPARRSLGSMCRPRCPETFDEMVRENCILSRERRKVCDQSTAFFLDDVGMCPPASPASPLKLKKQVHLNKQSKKEKIKSKKKKKKREGVSSKCSSSYEEWFSSDDEREEDDEAETEAETLFSSSRSFLSLSSRSLSFSSDPDSTRFNPRTRNRRKPPSSRRRKKSPEVSAVALEEKVRGSFAVVKRSSDPYSDFRTSMVEMIMEKQIFGARELEQLLQCFISLNSAHHHRVIVEVFAEICEALFSNLFT